MPDAPTLSPNATSVADGRQLWIERLGLAMPGERAAFDRVACLARRLLGVPVALVSTVTDAEQIFSGKTGITLSSTPLSHSLCQFVVRDNTALALPDTHANAAVCDHPAVRDLNIRAYLGVPFVAPDGTPLGSVCALDTVPHDWSGDDLITLRDLAAIVNTEIALRLEVIERTEREAVLYADNERLGRDVDAGSEALLVSTEALRAANAHLERSNRELLRQHAELRVFTGVLSHDLAEPVRKIRTFASLLRPALPDEEDRLHLLRLEHTAEQMHGQLRDLAEYAAVSLTDGQTAHTLLPLVSVVDDAVACFDPAEIRVERADLPTVRGRADLLGRLFVELLNNAARFRRHDVPLVVRITAEPFGDGFAIRVKDNGQGFEPRHGERIFAPFERLHRHHEHAGSGLGLTLCRRIAERHGGTLHATGTPGVGATFTLVLPADGPAFS